MIVVATLVGLLLNFVGIDPILALIYTTGINGVVAVPLVLLVALIAENATVMGTYASGWVSRATVWLTFLGRAAAAVAMFATLPAA